MDAAKWAILENGPVPLEAKAKGMSGMAGEQQGGAAFGVTMALPSQARRAEENR